MSKKTFKKGEVLSETSYYVVDTVKPTGLIVVDDLGNKIEMSKGYAESEIINSAEFFTSEEEKTATELAEIFINSSRVAMSVEYIKKDTVKGVRAYKAEKDAAIEKVTNAKVSDIPGLLDNLIENPITRIIPGESRVMKGRHYGTKDEFGRVHFIDMEEAKGANPAHDGRTRQVDPRTIQSVIVSGVKYKLKKK